jgi:hypothetical protein
VEFYLQGDWQPRILALLTPAVQEAFLVPAPDAMAEFLQAAITVILKPGKSPRQLASYRPITLLNMDVRLVVKVIADRLQLPLDLLIDPGQSAFIVDRDISDNVLFHLSVPPPCGVPHSGPPPS